MRLCDEKTLAAYEIVTALWWVSIHIGRKLPRLQCLVLHPTIASSEASLKPFLKTHAAHPPTIADHESMSALCILSNKAQALRRIRFCVYPAIIAVHETVFGSCILSNKLVRLIFASMLHIHVYQGACWKNAGRL